MPQFSRWLKNSGRASTPGKEEKLREDVEMDEAYVKVRLKGKRGLRRAPRRRGLKTRGRGTYDSDKAPVIAAVERGSGKVRLWLTATLEAGW